jgi:hypothetical protein
MCFFPMPQTVGQVGVPSPVTEQPPAKEESSDNYRTGITVVSAFEGYAFDAGMRVGDRLLSVDDVPVVGRSVDQVGARRRFRPRPLGARPTALTGADLWRRGRLLPSLL